MKEADKAAAGQLYDANYDEELLKARAVTKERLFAFNHTPFTEHEKRAQLLTQIVGKMGSNCVIEGPFHCDYGDNISIGDNFYANVNLVILDGARVSIGDNVFIAPNVGIHTAGHPLDAARRNRGLEYAWPITIESDVWIGAGVNILPGVTIGRGSVIGAGAVVTKSIPAESLAVGNPAKVVRQITEADALRFQ